MRLGERVTSKKSVLLFSYMPLSCDQGSKIALHVIVNTLSKTIKNKGQEMTCS